MRTGVATMNCGVVDQNSITLSSTHAGHSNEALALPAGYLITPADDGTSSSQNASVFARARGFSDLQRTRPPVGAIGWRTTSWWTGPGILRAPRSSWTY